MTTPLGPVRGDDSTTSPRGPQPITIHEPSPGSVIITYGRAGIDRCRAAISQYGYSATLRVQLNFHALTPGDVDAAETVIAEIARQAVLRAAALRASNPPLFDVVHQREHPSTGTPVCDPHTP